MMESREEAPYPPALYAQRILVNSYHFLIRENGQVLGGDGGEVRPNQQRCLD